MDNTLEEIGKTLYDARWMLLLVLIVILILWNALLKQWRSKDRQPSVDLRIDLSALGSQGPPETGPRLEFLGVPVRLAAVVFAPAGTAGVLPPIGQGEELLEALLPGLSKIAALHGTVMIEWPSQVSSKGFAHRFFAEAKLPGKGEKGSPWCGLAGPARWQGKVFLAGLIFRSEYPTQFGQEIVDSETLWRRFLTVYRG